MSQAWLLTILRIEKDKFSGYCFILGVGGTQWKNRPGCQPHATPPLVHSFEKYDIAVLAKFLLTNKPFFSTDN